MRIDLPRCNFKNCRYCFDSNCTKKTEYKRCEYRFAKSDAIKEFAERLNKQAFYVQQTEWEGRIVDCECINSLVEQMTEGDAQ